MKDYSLGIVGAGGIIASHLEAIAKLPQFRVVGVSDINPQCCQKIADKTGAAIYADYRVMLEEKPDVVLVATPHWLHCSMTVEALKAGCNVLVEKPMANSVEECQKMLTAASQYKRTLLVAEVDAFVPGAQRTGEHFRRGNLGRYFTSVCCNHRFYFAQERPEWFLDPEKSGGGMFSNVGLHRLAVTRSCIPGQKPVSVCATVSYQKDIPIEACTCALVRYKDGGAALYQEVGYYPKVQWANNGVHFVFEDGVVGWDDTKWRMVHKDGRMISEVLEPYRFYEPVYENLINALQGRNGGPCATHCAEDVAIVRAA